MFFERSSTRCLQSPTQRAYGRFRCRRRVFPPPTLRAARLFKRLSSRHTALLGRCLSGVDPRVGQVKQCMSQFHQAKRACHTLALQTAISSDIFGCDNLQTTNNGTVFCSCGPQAPRNNTGFGKDVKRQIRNAIKQVIPRDISRQAKRQCRSQCQVPFRIIRSCNNQACCSAMVSEIRHCAAVSPRAHNSKISEGDLSIHFQSHLSLQLPPDQYSRRRRPVSQRPCGAAGVAKLPCRRWHQHQH